MLFYFGDDNGTRTRDLQRDRLAFYATELYRQRMLFTSPSYLVEKRLPQATYRPFKVHRYYSDAGGS